MRTVIIVNVDANKMDEYFALIGEVYKKLSSVGVVSYSAGDATGSQTIELSPIPSTETLKALKEQPLPEVLLNNPEVLDQERERLKAMSKAPPPPPVLTLEEEVIMLASLSDEQRREYELTKPAGVQTGVVVRSKKKRVVG